MRLLFPAEQAHCYYQATNEPAADDEKVMPHITDTGAHYHNPAEKLKSVAFSLLSRLYIAPVIRGSDVEYQAYPGVHHS